MGNKSYSISNGEGVGRYYPERGDALLYPEKGADGVDEYISVISSAHCGRIRIDDIEVIEQEGRKLHIVTAEKDYAFYQRAADLIPALASRAFYRPVKGLFINFDQVKDISGPNISFYSGQVVTLGRNSISRTRTAYKRYLMKYPPYSLWERRSPAVSVSAKPTASMAPAASMSPAVPRSSGTSMSTPMPASPSDSMVAEVWSDERKDA